MSDTTPEATSPQNPGASTNPHDDADPGGGRVWSRPRPTPEQLRDKAARYLKPIDEDREIARLLGLGLSPEQAAERTGERLGVVLDIVDDLAAGEEVRPVTPEELGWRRAVGQLSTEEMMERLRTWPYTLGRIRGYDFWERGSWDDVDSLKFHGFLSKEEYHELRVIADSMPHPPDDPMPWEKKHQQQKQQR